jgi:heme oxygenase (biliverdin-IX-beta and delta-forming)
VQPEQQELLKELLSRQTVLSLAVTVEGEPVIGLLPFACTADHSALIVHASRLARHTRGLGDGAPFDALIHAPAAPGVDPLQIPRATFQGRVMALPDEGPALEAARTTYRDKLPSAEITLTLGDFRFFRLEIERGRLVAGFAQAASLTKDTLRRLP